MGDQALFIDHRVKCKMLVNFDWAASITNLNCSHQLPLEYIKSTFVFSIYACCLWPNLFELNVNGWQFQWWHGIVFFNCQMFIDSAHRCTI